MKKYMLIAAGVLLVIAAAATVFSWPYPTKAVPAQAEFQAVIDHAEGIRKTMPLFGQFDMEFLKQDYQAEQGE